MWWGGIAPSRFVRFTHTSTSGLSVFKVFFNSEASHRLQRSDVISSLTEQLSAVIHRMGEAPEVITDPSCNPWLLVSDRNANVSMKKALITGSTETEAVINQIFTLVRTSLLTLLKWAVSPLIPDLSGVSFAVEVCSNLTLNAYATRTR